MHPDKTPAPEGADTSKTAGGPWEYSSYRATLKRDGKPWAIVSPDGRNALSAADATWLERTLNSAPALVALIGAKEEECRRLREAIEQAPHSPNCKYIPPILRTAVQDCSGLFECDCWKSRALSAEATPGHAGAGALDAKGAEGQPDAGSERPASMHALKTWPEFYSAVVDGRKNFEVRLNDRGFKVGDVLVLQEFDPVAKRYTGEMTSRRVSYITNWNQFADHVVMAMAPIDTDQPALLAGDESSPQLAGDQIAEGHNPDHPTAEELRREHEAQRAEDLRAVQAEQVESIMPVLIEHNRRIAPEETR